MARLTAKQRRFVEEFLVDKNATQAAIRAGYSERAAKSIAAENLTKPHIAEAVEKGMAALTRKAAIDAKRVVGALGEIAFLDPADVVEWNGAGRVTVRASAELPPAVRRAIDSIERTPDGHLRIRFQPKTTALDKLAKHLGLYKQQVDVVHHMAPGMDYSRLTRKELAEFRRLLSKVIVAPEVTPEEQGEA